MTPVEYCGKRPIGNGWQHRVIDAGNIAQYFNDAQLNIGVVLGPTSHNLTDVDEDADVAICIGSYILSETKARFGRASKRDSHRLYYTDLSAADRPAAIAFDDPRKPKQQGRLIELRIGGNSGAQSVLPGSVHKSGETVAWEEDGAPATVDGDDLLQRVRTVAAYSLLARYWPAEGSGHHDTARVVGGLLARIGLSPAIVRIHVEAITRAANSPRWKELSALLRMRLKPLLPASTPSALMGCVKPSALTSPRRFASGSTIKARKKTILLMQPRPGMIRIFLFGMIAVASCRIFRSMFSRRLGKSG